MDSGPNAFQEAQLASELKFRNNIPDNLDRWHNSPRRQRVIMLEESFMTISVGDGSSRTLEAGNVLLAEDVSGQEYRTVVTSGWPRAMVPID